MKLNKMYYFMDIYAALVLILGILLMTGAYTQYGLHIFNPAPGVDHQFMQAEFGIMFALGAIVCLIFGHRDTRIKYVETIKVPARSFKRKLYTNGDILTYREDDTHSYAWPLSEYYKNVYSRKWYRRENLVIKKHYNRDKICRRTDVSF